MKILQRHTDYLKASLKRYEELENYEECSVIIQKLKCIKERNKEDFLNLYFDIQGLTEAGLLKKGMNDHERIERINTFFGYDTIFEYAKHQPILNCHISFA